MTTEAQQAAIDSNSTNCAVASGPGSGKTFVLVERAKRLVAQSRVVILITFTNRAAEEMRGRLGSDAEKVRYCGPLHKFCFRILREFGYILGYDSTNISILPEGESQRLIKQVAQRLGREITWREIREKSSTDALQIWAEYDATLKQNNVVDFDKILACASRLLDDKRVRGAFMCDDLLIEEAQDSAPIDWLIYSKIPAKRRFVVADVDQSIFAFRGGFPRGFVELTEHKDWQVHRLEINFRSDVLICRAAAKLIAYNSNRVRKRILAATCDDGVIRYTGCSDTYEELVNVAGRIRERIDAQSQAVLCRSNFEAKRVADYLESVSIPVARERAVFLPPDWDLAMTGIGMAADPENDILAAHCMELLGGPAHHIEELRLTAQAASQPLALYLPPRIVGAGPLTDIAHWLPRLGVSEQTTRYIMRRKLALGPDATLADLIHDLSQTFKDVKDTAATDQPSPEGSENVKELKDKVYVGTIHSAKGHEWDAVYLPAFEEGIIPHHGKKPVGPDELEEERRLAYVAITRARSTVFITTAENRTHKWGAPTSQTPSRFITEMGLTEGS